MDKKELIESLSVPPIVEVDVALATWAEVQISLDKTQAGKRKGRGHGFSRLNQK